MKRILFYGLFLLCCAYVQGQILISGFQANPAGTDSSYEYVQLIATEFIDFSSTPYTMVFSNNGNATTKGWMEGNAVTYGFYLNSGVVGKGDVFYVGGNGMRINGSGSASISHASWIKTKNVVGNAGDGFGSSSANGVLGDGGVADGIAVFKGQVSAADTGLKPVDCIFYGSSVSTAYHSGSGAGYTVCTQDRYDSNLGKFGVTGNDFLYADPAEGTFVALKGVFNIVTKKWYAPRTSVELALDGQSVLSDIYCRLQLIDGDPSLTLDLFGFSGNFGLAYLLDPLTQVFTLDAHNLVDSITIVAHSPFSVRTSAGVFTSDTFRLGGSTHDNIDIFVKFEPTVPGQYQDTIFISSAGTAPHEVYVNGVGALRPEFNFSTDSVVAMENAGTVQVGIQLKNPNNTASGIRMEFLPGGTAVPGVDFNIRVNGAVNNSNPVVTYFFPPNTNADLMVEFDILDNSVVQEHRSIKFRLYDPTNGGVTGANDTLLLVIKDNDYRKVNICAIKGVDLSGVPDSVGKRFEIRGVVYGGNFRNSGLPGYHFHVIQNACGITVFSTTDDVAYFPRQGDSVVIRGTVSHDRGLLILTQIDTIQVLNIFNGLKTPKLITKPDETSESDFVKLSNVTLVSPSGNWAAFARYKAMVFGSQDTFEIFIANEKNNLIGRLKPQGKFDLYGLSSQYGVSLSPPFFNGYVVYPRDTSDVVSIPDSLSAFQLLDPIKSTTVTISGLQSQYITFHWEKAIPAPNIGVPVYTFYLDRIAGDYSNALIQKLSSGGGLLDSVMVSFNELADMLDDLGVFVGQQFTLKWNVRAQSGIYSRWAKEHFNIILVREQMTGINGAEIAVVSLYPNPADELLNIQADAEIVSLCVYEMNGRLVLSRYDLYETTSTVDIQGLATGLYVMEIMGKNGWVVRTKFTKQ